MPGLVSMQHASQRRSLPPALHVPAPRRAADAALSWRAGGRCAQAAARALARELPSPPIELALTEAALAIAGRCSPAASRAPGAAARPADDAAAGSGEVAPDAGPPGERLGPAAAVGPTPADVVPAAVLAFLRRKVRRRPAPTQQAEAGPAPCCGGSCGGGSRGRGCSLALRLC